MKEWRDGERVPYILCEGKEGKVVYSGPPARGSLFSSVDAREHVQGMLN